MQTNNLQIAPQGVMPVVHASQYDYGREIKFMLFDGATAYIPPVGASVFVEGIKSDGNGFSYECSWSGNQVTFELTQQMTVFAETVPCELRIKNSTLSDIGTLNFKLEVEKSPIDGDTPISDTEIPAIIELAESEMLNAEAWANGTRGGDPVAPGDPAYHNNAKYWSDQASGVAVDMVGATSTTDGVHGLVPAPQAGDQEKVLKGDGTWGTISTTLSGLTDTEISNPTAGQVLSYENSKWKNKSLGTAAGKNITDEVTQDSTDLVESGGVYSALGSKADNTDLGSLETAYKNNVNNNGSKNLFAIKIYDLKSWNTSGSWSGNVYTANGVTFTCTVDSNDNVTNIALSNTASGAAVLNVYGFNGAGGWLPNKYKGLFLIGGKSETIRIIAANATDSSGNNRNNCIDEGNGIEIASTEDYTRIYVVVSDGAATGVSLIPMIGIETDMKLDSTYALYAKTNSQLTQDSVSWEDYSELGAVNWCPNDITTPQTVSDGTTTFTFTPNADKSITVSAPSYPVTLASQINLVLHTFTGNEDFVGKVVKVSGGVGGGIRLVAYRAKSVNGSTGSADVEASPNIFTWLNNGSGTKANIKIEIIKNAVLTKAVTFKPMITNPSYNGPYVPYAMTNRELTEEVTPINLECTLNSTYINDGAVYATKIGNLVVMSGYFHVSQAAPRSTVLITLPSGITPFAGNAYGVGITDTDAVIRLRLNNNTIVADGTNGAPAIWYNILMSFVVK